MASALPFLSPAKPTSSCNIVCFVCGEVVKKSQKQSQVKDEGLGKFKNQAKDWEKLTIPSDVFEHKYTLVAARLKGKTKDEKIVLHANCRKNFGFASRLEKLKNKYEVDDSLLEE